MRIKGYFRLGRRAMATLLALMLAMPAAAQFSDSYNFLKAVRDKDGEKVMKALEGNKSTLINTRDYTSGESALHIVTKRRDDQWMRFLIAKGANPDIKDSGGNTPLMLAAQLGFPEGEAVLIENRASINATNARGETPLIAAVQLRDIVSVRLLLANGADPSISDHFAGMSARDYAQRDPRAGPILKLLQEASAVKKPASRPVAGPGL